MASLNNMCGFVQKNLRERARFMKLNLQTISVGTIIGLLIAIGGAYLDARDRLTTIEAKLDILAPMAVDYMVHEELVKRGLITGYGEAVPADEPPVVPPPRYGEDTVGGDETSKPPKPLSKEEFERLRREKEEIYRRPMEQMQR